MSTPEPVGALAQWHRELLGGNHGQRAHVKSSWRTGEVCHTHAKGCTDCRGDGWVPEPLYEAACAEAAGLEARAAGLHRTAALHFERAAMMIVGAIAERAA